MEQLVAAAHSRPLWAAEPIETGAAKSGRWVTGSIKAIPSIRRNRPIRRLYPSLKFISLDGCSLPPASCHPKSTWNTTCHLQIKHQYRWKLSI
ncbi:hypothetical protein PM082_006835 [Marasmius tenuissimus]|nr:hypothetical protein PM082_006835 [Marasmius tenuissimus]